MIGVGVTASAHALDWDMLYLGAVIVFGLCGVAIHNWRMHVRTRKETKNAQTSGNK